MQPLTKKQAGEIVVAAKVAAGVSWKELAELIGRPPVWTVSALLGQQPMPAHEAEEIGKRLDLEPAVVSALQLQPTRGSGPEVRSDPTIYRFYEALDVYGPAIKALIHEEFGDGIMSAINFKVDVSRRPDPNGDRVVVVFEGKFLDYHW
jgi:cyanate lyase